LVLALALMSGWLRSLTTRDDIIFPDRKQKTSAGFLVTSDDLASSNGLMLWGRICEESTNPADRYIDLGPAYPLWKTALPTTYTFDDPELKWRWRWWGFGICENSDQRVVGVWESILIVPYWMIAVPLTLICVWLIPLRSRKLTELRKEGPNEALPQANLPSRSVERIAELNSTLTDT
jgi:hypothetical protein